MTDNSKLSLEERGLRFRGEVIDFYLDGNILTISQNTAWCEQEGFRKCLEEKYDCKVYYMDEEPGCENYTTNDESGEFFSDKYILETENCTEYFSSWKNLLEFIKSEFGIEVTPDSSLDQIEKKIEEQHEEEDFQISIYEIQYVND